MLRSATHILGNHALDGRPGVEQDAPELTSELPSELELYRKGSVAYGLLGYHSRQTLPLRQIAACFPPGHRRTRGAEPPAVRPRPGRSDRDVSGGTDPGGDQGCTTARIDARPRPPRPGG